MIQVYPFHGTDVQEVYTQLNSFLNELAIIGLMVAPDDIRSNTKYYPDYDRTATTIEVFIGMDSLAPDVNGRDQIREMHRAVVAGKPEQEEAAVNPADFDPFLVDPDEEEYENKTPGEKATGDPFPRES